MKPIQPFRKKKRISDKNLSLNRKIRGYAILAKGDMPIAVSEEEFLVPSQSSDKKYKVTNISGWKCECQDFQNRYSDCKSEGHPYVFDDIDWDGRNQSLIWGRKVFETLRRYE